MEKQELKIENPATVNGVTVIPVVNILRKQICQKNSAYIYVEKKPVAVIVLRLHGYSAYGANGEEIPLQELLRELPELADLIRGS